MRLFIAIPVSEAVKSYATALRSELDQNRPDVKWVETENYHLTLKFLGEVEPASVTGLKEKLMLVAESCPPFKLQARGVGFFPNRNRPRVVWVGMRGEMEKAEFLGERIDSYLEELGYDPEKRRSFHLTLGRLRSEMGVAEMQLKAAGVNKRQEKISFQVDRFVLMESTLSSRGPSYTALQSYFLEG